MKNILLPTILAVTVAISATLVNSAEAVKPAAVELPKVAKFENVTWHSLWYFQFKASQADKAIAVWERFEPVWRKANPNQPLPLILKPVSGKWHLLVIWTIPDGAKGLEWRQSPQDENFWKALAEEAGGAEKAMGLWTDFVDCIQDQQTEIAIANKATAK